MISISNAKSSGLSAIESLLKSVWGDTNDISFEQFVVAKDDDKLIGCVRIKYLDKDCLELTSLAVLEGYRGKKVGSKLMEEILKKENKRPVYLLCFVDKKIFYTNFGFSVIESNSLPNILKNEYNRVFNIFKQQNKEIIAMVCI
jgi:amino-acid N-acetyltransferase